MALMFVASLNTSAAPSREIVRFARDFNLTPASGSPTTPLVANNKLYFVATDGTHGIELWQTDGTNVTRLTDLSYGSVNSFIGQPTLYNGEIYFRGTGITNGNSNIELWKLSGTNASLVADIRTNGSSNPLQPRVYNGVLYFAASDGITGTELWAYNGVTAYQALDLNSGPGSSTPSGLMVFNGSLCFAASNSANGTEVRLFNGSSTTTLDINPGSASSNPSGFTEFNGVLYFQATEATGGAELWQYNGSVASRVADIRTGTSGSSPANFLVYNNSLYFSANDGVNGTELWNYNGITAPTRVTQIAPASASASPANLAVYKNALCFSANDGSTGVELWKYDGVSATRIADINPDGNSSPASLIVYNGYLYFAATDIPTGRELWRYDGTNVSRFAEIHSGSAGSTFGASTTFNGDYYFSAFGTNYSFNKYDGTNFTVVNLAVEPEGSSDLLAYKGALYFTSQGASIVSQIWRYDGTNTTSMGGQFSENFGDMIEYKGLLYVAARNSGLWKCDGTNATIALDVWNGSANIFGFTIAKGLLYFYANDGSGQGLWRFDGTNALRIGATLSFGSYDLLELNGRLYFGAATNGTAIEPWTYDGTNFSQLAHINGFNTNSSTIFWTVFRNRAYFSGVDGTNGLQLWSTDGTNVTRVTSLAGGASYYAVTAHDTLYFWGDDGITGYELWKFDGQTVSQVADISLGFLDSAPYPQGVYKNTLFFIPFDEFHGTELWRVDPLSDLVRITALKRQGNDTSLSWTTPGGMTNVLQSAGGGLSGSLNTNFTDRSIPLVAPTGEVVTVNYLDIGGATNSRANYYRVRVP